jgi:lipoprotein-anchoring transpeptidase ErfK/SrfK
VFIVGGMLTAGVVMLVGSASLLLLLSLSSSSRTIEPPEARIASGVTVAGVDLSEKSVAEATSLLFERMMARTITATDGARSWSVRLADLGIAVDVNSTIEEAQTATAGSSVPPRYIVDLNQTQSGLFALSEQVNIPAVSGNPPQMGRAIDIPVVLDRLRVDVTGELADDVLELNMIDVEPAPLEPPRPTYDGPTTTHVVERGQELGLIAREYGVSVDDIVAFNNILNPDVIYVGQELIIPAAGVYVPPAPPAPTNSGRSLLVVVSQQRLYAYQDGQVVHSHLVSTGLPATPTVLGDYNIYVKYAADDMQGADYFLPQVPYVMYFYQGYGIHGTYWHNSFGRPMSHGCVNLPVNEAEWFFNFAEVGTLVRVIQ